MITMRPSGGHPHAARLQQPGSGCYGGALAPSHKEACVAPQKAEITAAEGIGLSSRPMEILHRMGCECADKRVARAPGDTEEGFAFHLPRASERIAVHACAALVYQGLAFRRCSTLHVGIGGQPRRER